MYSLFSLNPMMQCACIVWGTKSYQNQNKMSLLMSYKKLEALKKVKRKKELKKLFIAPEQRQFVLILTGLGALSNARAALWDLA